MPRTRISTTVDEDLLRHARDTPRMQEICAALAVATDCD